MIYFTSDWRLGKPNLPNRRSKSINQTNFKKSEFKDGDTLYHLGNVIYNLSNSVEKILEDIKNTYPNSEFILIKGKYDTENKMPILTTFFNDIREDATLDYFDFGLCYLNNCPLKAIDLMQEAKYGIVGQFNSLFEITFNLLNVSVEASNFKLVSEKKVMRKFKSVQKYLI